MIESQMEPTAVGGKEKKRKEKERKGKEIKKQPDIQRGHSFHFTTVYCA